MYIWIFTTHVGLAIQHSSYTCGIMADTYSLGITPLTTMHEWTYEIHPIAKCFPSSEPLDMLNTIRYRVLRVVFSLVLFTGAVCLIFHFIRFCYHLPLFYFLSTVALMLWWSNFAGADASETASKLDGALDVQRALSLLSASSRGLTDPGHQTSSIIQFTNSNQNSTLPSVPSEGNSNVPFWVDGQHQAVEPQVFQFTMDTGNTVFPDLERIKPSYESSMFGLNQIHWSLQWSPARSLLVWMNKHTSWTIQDRPRLAPICRVSMLYPCVYLPSHNSDKPCERQHLSIKRSQSVLVSTLFLSKCNCCCAILCSSCCTNYSLFLALYNLLPNHLSEY